MLPLAHPGGVVLVVSGVTAVSGMQLSASGTTACFPGLYTISIGVSVSFLANGTVSYSMLFMS